MSQDKESAKLSEAELRELIPQLQELTEKYKRSELIQKALFDISELAGSVSELSRLYPAIHEIVGGLMDARNFFVAFHEQDEEQINFVYFVDQFDELTVTTVPSSDVRAGLTGYILQSGQHLFMKKETMQAQLADIQVNLLGAAPVDWIGVPLKRGTQAIGALVVQSYDDSVRYTQADVEMLLFVSQHIVNTVDRVKSRELTETTIRERTKQLRQINEELQDEILERQKIESLQQALFEISELSASVDENMDGFYSNLHGILSRLIAAPNCYVAMLDDNKQGLHFPYYSDEISSKVDSRALGKGLTEYVLRHGRAELVDSNKADLLAQQDELDTSIARDMKKNFNSWLGSPLVVDGEVAGVIAVQSYGSKSSYTLKDLELLRFVSHHIAVAMERKRSADAIQLHNQKLEEKVKARTEELNKTNIFLQKQIDQRKEIELKLIHDAHHDALTELPNRVMFNSRLELAIANKKRHGENNFAVLFIDLDRFKLINDTLGHYAGDQFLIEVSSRIQSCIRGHDLLARLGGDEFVILLDSFDSMVDVEEVASRIIASVSAPFIIENKEMYSGASIGIAYIENGYESADEIIRDADAAMYQAKAMGRGRYVMFDKSMRDKLLEELELENEFRRTLKASQFDCYLQKTVNLKTRQELYSECYIRWNHPKLGKIKREQFWLVAEHSGLTIEIDNYVLQQAFGILKLWQQRPEDAQRKVAVNLSINHLMQEKLVNHLIAQIKDAGVDASKLVFEFDENDLNRRSQFMLPAIKRLKRAGVTLVLDNFGSGLASLSYLYNYPFDYIKVDHRFVKSLPRSQRNLSLVESILAISQHLKFQIIAEGVESEEQLAVLCSAGCDYGQGKLLHLSEKVDLRTETKALSA